MKEFGPATFGELNAEDYDALHDPGTTEESVALISELAGTGKILELAIGTGRMALPLVARGHDVSGVEGSPEMIAKLREKPNGADIPVEIGDYADVPNTGPFDFVFLVFNTLFNLAFQADQVRCFHNVADRLAPGGTFLVETFIPDLTSFTNDQRMRTMHVDFKSVWFEAVKHDPVTQVLEHQRVRMSEDGTKLIPLVMRYAWPMEIDLMAQMAGLELEHRWGGWKREAFTAKSDMHVSVYRKPA